MNALHSAAVALAILGGTAAGIAGSALLAPQAQADTINAYEDDGITHVNLSELPTIDSMPVCVMEDGSDIDPALLPCVWHNDGNDWLTFENRSYLIVDDTVR